MSWALLEIGAFNGAGVKMTQHAVFEAGRLAKKRTTVNPRQRPLGLLGWEKRLFQANFRSSRKRRGLAETGAVLTKMNGISRRPERGESASHSRPRNAAAARRSRHSSRRRHRPGRSRNSRSRSGIVARAIIIAGSRQRAADDGAADHARQRPAPKPRWAWAGAGAARAEMASVTMAASAINVFLMALTFPHRANRVASESSIFPLNDQ